MAEVAVGAGAVLAAEQVISTTAEAGVATYWLAKPTLPLKATFTRIAIAHDEELKRLSLTRSHHTLTTLNQKAYIFGGVIAEGNVATNEMHVVNLAPGKVHDPEYQVIPALGTSGPQARSHHASCAFGKCIAIYGGKDEHGNPIKESPSLWTFDTETREWDSLSTATGERTPGPRVGAKLFAHGAHLILVGGSTNEIEDPADVWLFDSSKSEWITLPPPPASYSATNAAFHEGTLYIISSSDQLSSQLHTIQLPNNPQDFFKKEQSEQPQWTTISFPTNPLTPGPISRYGGALLPLSTGHGRNYLLYLLGARENTVSASLPNSSSTIPTTGTSGDLPSATKGEQEEAAAGITQHSDAWVIQIPSSSVLSGGIKEGLKMSKIKDAIKSGVGAESNTWNWSKVVVQVPDDLGSSEGKLHPGPRAWFGADMADGKTAVFWGGEGPQGEKVGDGWTIMME